jgi:putative FmdB family regulatory protein
MPIHDYLCPFCNRLTELTVNGRRAPKTVKCECGSKARKQVSTGTTFILRGGGTVSWSEDGYCSNSGGQ